MNCEKIGEAFPSASMEPAGKSKGMYMVVPVEMLLLLPHPKFTELEPVVTYGPR